MSGEPQWEDCKVCGGDHWTKDHHDHCDPRAHQEERPAPIKAAGVGYGTDGDITVKATRWEDGAFSLESVPPGVPVIGPRGEWIPARPADETPRGGATE